MNPQETRRAQSLTAHGGRPESAGRRAGNFLLSVLWSSIVLLALPCVSSAQSVLTDDAHTSTAPKATDANFGTNPNLNVSASGNVYIKFRLSPTLPADTPGSAVERATLKLYIGNITAPGRLDLYAVAGPWEEGTVTGNNSPPLGQLVTTTAQITTDRRHKFLVVDVTALVRQWLGDDGHGTNGIPNHGLALVARPADASAPEVANVTFDSKENSQTSHEAQLNIQLARGADGLQRVEHDASLTGDGTAASPLGVAAGGIDTVHLADDAVTGGKIADNAVTSSELADGAVTSPKITAPLSLTSADASFTLSAANTGAGAAITATGAINTSTHYNIGGQRVLSVSGGAVPNSNVFAGVGAGGANTTGSQNAFFGSEAGRQTTTGGGNSFFGASAGNSNTTGEANSFVGNFAGFRNTTGGGNNFFGQNTGYFNTEGDFNAFFGHNAGNLNTTGTQNAFFGQAAGFGNTTASQNAFFGSNAGTNNKTGSNNTVIGAFANVGADNLSYATAVGAGAVVGSSNTLVLGRNADTVQVPGALNVAGTFGANILDAGMQFNIGGNRVLSVSGNQFFPNSNTFAGVGAGASNTSGVANSFFGQAAGLNNTGGGHNSFFGWEAGRDNAGDSNAFFGSFAGLSNTGYRNSFFGSGAGFQNTAGAQNSFFGDSAGASNTTGAGNAFLGSSAGIGNTSGTANTFVGSGTGLNNTTGGDNTVIGYFANVGAGNLTNATAIGAFAVVGASDTIVIGKTAGNYRGIMRPADTVQIPGALYVSGPFSANVLDAATQFNLGGSRILSNAGTGNLFVGVGTGAVNTTGINNSFFGKDAGVKNTTGGANAFFGADAGANNTSGSGNSFFGAGTGVNNTGGGNTFIGASTGVSNANGSNNSFLGVNSGFNNTTGGNNVFVGLAAGQNITIGSNNTFIGSLSGNPDTATQVNNSTAIGFGARVTQSNSLVLGESSTNVGIGTTAPKAKLHVTSGKIYVEANGQGVILKSPGGACFELTVTDAGALATSAVACP